MKNLKEMLLEYVGVSNWTSRLTWDTAGKEENLFKKLAIGLTESNFDKVKDSVQKFCDELQKHKDVKPALRRAGSSPKGKFAVGIKINDDADEYKDYVMIDIKLDRRVRNVFHNRAACKKGSKHPFCDWERRGMAVDIWADYSIILSIDEDSPLVDEMEEFVYNSGILEYWVKSFN